MNLHFVLCLINSVNDDYAFIFSKLFNNLSTGSNLRNNVEHSQFSDEDAKNK